MPTPAELATNHIIHNALVATNFFGTNTIPIALNEADYARMWVQAAEIMATYRLVTKIATSAVPGMRPAPVILTCDAEAPPGRRSTFVSSFCRLVDQIVKFLSELGTPRQIEGILQFFQQFFERLGFSPIMTADLALIALFLYDVLWYPYYASYSLLLLPFLLPC